MPRMTEQQIAESRRATERAKAVLKPGDRLYVKNCGDSRSTVAMIGWAAPPFDCWITSKARDDIHAMHILKVNGVPTSFADPVAA